LQKPNTKTKLQRLIISTLTPHLVKKLLPLTIYLLLSTIFYTYSQKGTTKPTSNLHLRSSPSCPLALSIQDNIPAAVCSELLKTLVAVTGSCTDTTAVRYRWSSNIGGVFSTSRTTTFNLPEFLITTPVTFTVWVVEGSDSLSANYTINIKPRPNSPSLTPFGTIILCDNNPVTLTSSACTGGSTTVWSNGASGVSSISVPAIGRTYYSVACYKNGCISDSTAAAAFITGVTTTPPTTISRTICEGTPIAAGSGLQAQLVNCGNIGASGTYTYAGPTVGYDDGFRNTGGIDPSVIIPAGIGVVSKVKISITWRKQKGGFQNDCGVGDTQTWPYHNETQFRIKSPSGRIINLVYTGSYGGSNNPTVTTVFEDGTSPINYYSPPVSGTFSPAQPLSGFIGEDAAGTWTLLPYDAVWKDPLCVSGFAVTLVPNTQNGTITWWDAPTGGNQIGSGTEFIPTVTAAGTHTYYAQGQCTLGCPSVRTATTLLIKPTPLVPATSINIPLVNGVRSICYGESVTITATGCSNGGTVDWTDDFTAPDQLGSASITGDTYTFIPVGGNVYSTTHTIKATCTGTNQCRSAFSTVISYTVKAKPSPPTISGSGTSACLNSVVTLTASSTYGGTFGWTGNRVGNPISFILTSNTNIKVANTRNGCTGDSSSIYSISTLPKPNKLTVNASQVQALCYGSSVTLTTSACVGTIKWTGNLSGSPLTVTPLSSKDYKASCLSSNGCSSDSSTALNIIVLPKTKPVITGNSFVCGPTVTTLIATGCSGVNETVVWRNESIGSIYNETITQTKTFRAVCIRNGYCVSDSSDIFTVQYRIKPSQPTITPPQNTTICQGTSVSLSATACTGGTSGWTGGLTGQTVSVSPNANKSYKVACLINGCLSDSSLAVSLTVIAKPTLPIINQVNPTICAGQNIILSVSAVNGASYNWTGGLTGNSISISPSVSKTFKVASTINGCVSDSANVVVSVNILPTAPNITLGGEVCSNTLPAKVWDNLISTPSGCSVNALLTTTDGGTFTVVQEQSAIKIAKLNSSGTVVWSRYLTYNNITYRIPQINTAIATIDGGYLLGGKMAAYAAFGDANFVSKPFFPNGLATEDFWILKIDANGVAQWSKNYGGDNEDVINKIEKTDDGGYLLGGTTSSSQGYDVSESGSSKDYWLVKIDAIGNKLWDKRYSSTAPASLPVEKLSSLKVLNNGDFLIGGSNYNGSSYYNYHVVKANSLGTKLWENYYGNSTSNSILVDIETFADNSIILSGSTTVASDQDVWLVKINDSGVKLWDKFIGTIGLDDAHTILKIPNENNILLGARTYTGISRDKSEPSKGGNDMWILKIKSDGTKIWDKTVGGSSDDYITKIALNANSEIVLGGFSSSPASGDKTINGPGAWFVKIASSCPANVSSTICKRDSVSLKANNCTGTVNWSNGSVGSTLIAKPIITTNYTATCTNINGCISPLSSVFTVTVSTPPSPTITPPTNSTICQGSNITLSATGCSGGTFAWTGGLTGTSISVSPSVTKAYKVACTLNSCVSDSSSTVVITVIPSPIISLVSNKTSICLGDSAFLTVSGCTGSISWNNGATTSVIKVSPIVNTTYTSTCTVGSCSASQAILVSALSTPTITSSGVLQCGQTITLTANNFPIGSNIQWRKNGVNISGATNNTLIISTGGSYDFVVGTTISTQFEINYLQILFNNRTNLQFVNSTTGYALFNYAIKKTNDGGLTWTEIYLNSNLNHFYFNDASNGWAVGNQLIAKTTNGGITWTAYNGNLYGTNFIKVTFKDNNIGIALTDDSRTYYTLNGGQTWTLNSASVLPSNPFMLEVITFVPTTSTIFAFGSDPLTNRFLKKSIDNGASWTNIIIDSSNPTGPLYDIFFLDANNGWICGASNVIYKTSDGGNTWNNLPNNGGGQYYENIDFVSANVGYLTSGNGIYKTINGGTNWSLFVSDPDPLLESCFVSEDYGWFSSLKYISEFNIQRGLIKKVSTPKCPTIPIVLTTNCCAVFETIKSGSWTDPTTWSCNKVPTAADDIFINTGHTITDSGNTIHAKTLNYRGGILQLSATTNFILR
jgi:photosystem II stability/assembly factor-like uncharacterized protein